MIRRQGPQPELAPFGVGTFFWCWYFCVRMYFLRACIIIMASTLQCVVIFFKYNWNFIEESLCVETNFLLILLITFYPLQCFFVVVYIQLAVSVLDVQQWCSKRELNSGPLDQKPSALLPRLKLSSYACSYVCYMLPLQV